MATPPCSGGHASLRRHHAKEVRRAARAALGIFEEHYTHIKRYQYTLRLRELIDLVREYQASVIHPPHCSLIIEPHSDMTEELQEIKAREKELAPATPVA